MNKEAYLQGYMFKESAITKEEILSFLKDSGKGIGNFVYENPNAVGGAVIGGVAGAAGVKGSRQQALVSILGATLGGLAGHASDNYTNGLY